MPIIRCKQNYGYYNVTLGSEQIGVKRRNGEFFYVTFRGYITAEIAKQLSATPVKLKAHAYSMGLGADWIELADNEYIQGALIDSTAVYAVLAANNRPRVVNVDI